MRRRVLGCRLKCFRGIAGSSGVCQRVRTWYVTRHPAGISGVRNTRSGPVFVDFFVSTHTSDPGGTSTTSVPRSIFWD